MDTILNADYEISVNTLNATLNRSKKSFNSYLKWFFLSSKQSSW